MDTIRSVYENQTDILKSILLLHCPSGIECDVTYGNGQFYKDIKHPSFKFDINPQTPDTIEACSTKLPLLNGSLNSLMFDPPFLTYVRQGREGNGNMIMSKRFSGYWRYDELEKHYIDTIIEAKRVLKNDGIFIIKCQDIIHNHKMHCTHSNVINWASSTGFRLLDLFILVAKNRMPSPNRKGIQKHARVFHSYFMVFK